jgi:Flp pilus assembly protein TadB
MAQTKRRRTTKHRGNAAGMIETRGRTGRKPTEGERKSAATGSGKTSARGNRFDKPPTWRGSLNRALIAVVAFAALILLVPGFHLKPIAVIPLAAVMLAIYVPMGFYTDQYMYRRRQRKLAEQRSAGK